MLHCRACEGPLTPYRPGTPAMWCNYCHRLNPPDESAEQTVRAIFALPEES